MLVPEVFGDNFDEWIDDPWSRWFHVQAPQGNTAHRMTTDVKETADSYIMEMELPGFSREEINADIKDGYLTISASHSETDSDKGNEGRYVRRERYKGAFSRTFFVGENIEPDDVHAKFENGILTLTVPKNVQPRKEEKKTIAID